jgi:hypothetical protein
MRMRRGIAGAGEGGVQRGVVVAQDAGGERQYSTLVALAVGRRSSADWERVGLWEMLASYL